VNLLVDANLSPAVAAELCDAGHDAVHVIDVGLATALDPEIADYADANDLVIVTVDTDFPMLIALRRATSPSVVLLRGVNELAPDQHAALLIANLPAVTDDLQRGAIVSLGPDHLRVRSLPLA
jgi:predicted nuclease of predicted toxin-antitoxin system